MNIDDKVIQRVYGLLELAEVKSEESMLGLLGSQPYLLKMRTELQREYYQAREKLRVPKDKEFTDFDRNTMLDAYSAEVREKYELVKGLEELVSERISLIRVLLEAK